MTAPDVGSASNPKQATAVCFVHMEINHALRSRRRALKAVHTTAAYDSSVKAGSGATRDKLQRRLR
jgi:hypothetical protein